MLIVRYIKEKIFCYERFGECKEKLFVWRLSDIIIIGYYGYLEALYWESFWKI